jgi:hypothetical protein
MWSLFPKPSPSLRKIPRLKRLCSVLFIFVLLSAGPAAAASYRFEPAVRVGGGYDDNILFVYDDKVADAYMSIKPSLLADFGSQRLGFRLDAAAEIIRFAEEKDLDVENYNVGAGLGYRASQKISLSGKVSYIRDTTLDSELEETGRVTDREQREQYRGDAGVSYQLGELSNIGLDYVYTQTLYASDSLVNRVANRLSLPYSRRFNNNRDTWSISPSYSLAETENDVTIDYYNLTMGWGHVFNNTWSMRNYIGYGHTRTKEDGEETPYNAGNADLSLTKKGDIWRFTVGFRSYITLDSQGDLREVDRLYIQFRKRMTEKLFFLLAASTYASRPVDIFNQIDSWYYDLRPELGYRLTPRHNFNLFYRYSSEEDRSGSNNDYRNRNLVELRYTYNFPIQK